MTRDTVVTHHTSVVMTRYSGRQPLRPSLGAEYAVAVVWAEAALQAARAEAERAEVGQFLETARAEHNRRWVEPRRGNFPNEVTVYQKRILIFLKDETKNPIKVPFFNEI